jgi:crossover junction endodeoxyribonuclease RuvC
MKILGIDPGIGRTGWGIIEIRNGQLEMENCGCIETAKELSIDKRLSQLHSKLKNIVKHYSPDTLAIEELFFGANAKTALIVGQARGVVLLTAAQAGISLAFYTPLQVKIALTGYGRAEKQQVEKMVMTILRMRERPQYDDTADALAIAITHAYSYRALERR